MSINRPSRKSSTFSDAQFVEISGTSVHTPGEQARPRHANRPREVFPLEESSAQIVDFVSTADEQSSAKAD
jgi:hypothetical protein